MSTADTLKDSSPSNTILTPSSDDIEAVIQMATSTDGRTGPIKDTRTQLFVGNLPYRVRWQDLKDLFRKAGTVLRADVSLGPDNRSRGYGTVLLATAEDAGRAIDMFNGYSWQTRVLEVRPDRMGSEVDQQNCFDHLTQASTVTGASNPLLAVSPFLVGRGAAGASSELDYTKLLGLDNSPPNSSGSSTNTSGGGRNLFVGNLPFHCQWQDLKDLFRQAGTIIRADVALGQDGRSRGFGTVVFATETDAERALRMFNGYEYNGRPLKVHYDKFSQSTHPAILPMTSLSPNFSSLSTSLSTPASPAPRQQTQKFIPPHLSHLLSTSHIGSSLLPPSSPLPLLPRAASPRHANSYPSSRPLSPHPPTQNVGLDVHQQHTNVSNRIIMPAGYTLDFGPSSQPSTPYQEGLSAGAYFPGGIDTTTGGSEWPPRPSALSGESLKEGELTVSSLAERIIGKGLGGLSLGDSRDTNRPHTRPAFTSCSGTGTSNVNRTALELSGILTRRSSVTNSAISATSSTGSAGSGSLIGSGRISRTNSGDKNDSGNESQSVSGSGSGATDLSSARTTPLSDPGLEDPQQGKGKERDHEKEKEKEKEKEVPQLHPHHPGTISIPPPPKWGPPQPQPSVHPHSHSYSHSHPHPGYVYPNYPIPSPSAYPIPHNPAQMTPHGLPPITPTMPPFTFYNPGMGSPMPSPALTYPISPYAMTGGTPLHSPGITGYHPIGMMMVTPTAIMPPPPPTSAPQMEEQIEQDRPGTARRSRAGSGASSPADEVDQKGDTDKGEDRTRSNEVDRREKLKEDDNPYFSFASVSSSQQQQPPAPHPPPSMPPHYHLPMHMALFSPMHPMTPFSPGLAVSPWEPNPYINPAVGAPVHHPHPPAGGYFVEVTPSSVGVELGSGSGAHAGVGGYFDSMYDQEGRSSLQEAGDRPVSEAVSTKEPQHQKRAESYNLNLPSFNSTASQEKAEDRFEMTRTQSMSSAAASRPQMQRPDSDP
ncbi:hypothetical protein E1B28_006139 [Marasmius oreades]|uniref:RRM domain-containing protein n=1 Tax=Marasmius oreades TaxID=181124 RepID=A0A9P7S4W0_9AGAR|nr:uncharacterized protein E1B28_006139 [Marasmius oreades]KAG7095382.1 hypothetical protein E1B28_006139 [Marasmius oreades]